MTLRWVQVLTRALQHVTLLDHLCGYDWVECTDKLGLITGWWSVKTQSKMTVPCDNGGRDWSDSASSHGPPGTGRTKGDASPGGFEESKRADTPVLGFSSALDGRVFTSVSISGLCHHRPRGISHRHDRVGRQELVALSKS